MYLDSNRLMGLFLIVALVVSSEAFFLKWGSDTTQASAQKAWVQQMSPSMSPAFRYQYAYSPYETRKLYQMQNTQYPQPEMSLQQSMAPIPISMPAGASLTPVSLQHVQLVPCMCPVAPEEAEKLQDQMGQGPFIAQTFTQPAYPQQITVAADNTKTSNKQ